jgi:hypothetical protein
MTPMLTRRDVLRLAAAAPVLALRPTSSSFPASAALARALADSEGRVVSAGPPAWQTCVSSERGTETSADRAWSTTIWGSLGLVHGSRSSNDIKRDWKRFTTIARQNLGRNWQNGRLWWNDPDAVVLTGDLGEEEFRFHATSIYASGGMIPSGDDLTKIGPARLWTGDDHGRHPGGVVPLDLAARSGRVLLCRPA